MKTIDEEPIEQLIEKGGRAKMRTPEEIKRSLAICADHIAPCCECDYYGNKNPGCATCLKKETLEYIRQLEDRIAELEAKPDKPAPAPVQYGLPKGWIELHRADGLPLLCNSSAIKMVINYADGSAVYLFGESCGNSVRESVEEILEKIREATT